MVFILSSSAALGDQCYLQGELRGQRVYVFATASRTFHQHEIKIFRRERKTRKEECDSNAITTSRRCFLSPESTYQRLVHARIRARDKPFHDLWCGADLTLCRPQSALLRAARSTSPRVRD